MTHDLPEPLVPAGVDCRHLDGFMLNCERLLASELIAVSTGEEIRAALILWCRCWKQIPAGSLPDDDQVLAGFAMVSRTKWKRLREGALRGFVPCSDGRLYHPLIAVEALKAAEKSRQFQEKRQREADRLREWRERQKQLREGGDETPSETPSYGDETRFVPVRQGQGQGQKQPTNQKPEDRESSLRSDSAGAEAPAKRARRKPGKPLPDDWRPTDGSWAYAAKAGMTEATIENHVARLRDWAVANDHRRVDWQSTFRTFVNRWDGKQSRGAKPNGGLRHAPAIDEARRNIVAGLGLDSADDDWNGGPHTAGRSDENGTLELHLAPRSRSGAGDG